jgi:radical SAM superfamily enzyme YgiQ (UPF0313 family)
MPENRSRILLISFTLAGHDSLALGYIKAFAMKDPTVSRRTEIEILTFSNEQGDVRQALYYIFEFKPHLIGLSCYCWSMGNILELARSVKQTMAEVTLVAGGPEVGPIADKYLAQNNALDVVVHDEGEAVFLDLIRHFFAGKGRLEDIAGISFRRGQGWSGTKIASLLKTWTRFHPHILRGY